MGKRSKVQWDPSSPLVDDPGGQGMKAPTSSYLSMFKSLNLGPNCIIFSLSPHLSVNFSNMVTAITLGARPKTARPPAQWLMAISVISLCPWLVHLSIWCMDFEGALLPARADFCAVQGCRQEVLGKAGFHSFASLVEMTLKTSWRLSQSTWVVLDLQS